MCPKVKGSRLHELIDTGSGIRQAATHHRQPQNVTAKQLYLREVAFMKYSCRQKKNPALALSASRRIQGLWLTSRGSRIYRPASRSG